jgi:hydrogenase maturation protein HypF
MTALSCLGTEPHSPPQQRKGVELTVQGTVQGVGFRPFVYRLARDFNISGTIANTGRGVVIQAEGLAPDLDNFLQALTLAPPPLARIFSISQRRLPAGTDNNEAFTILASSTEHASQTMIPADIALCDDCRQELLDPADRRYRYPFINCTNCGPRFTIVSAIPYDRSQTSMHSFPMCRSCQAEYDDPDNRRFHAQPNACSQCGPQISWHAHTGEQLPCQDPVSETIRALNDSSIVGIRGMGGFHLVVDASSESAVARLRERKQRKSKPLAIMVADLKAAGRICHLSPGAGETLASPAHPIVLLPKKETSHETASLAPNLAARLGEIGVMLPYTPLHHLLFATPGCPQALVMTSGNRNGEPLCTGNHEAVSHLGDIADFFLLHNREIVTRIDDSVIRIMQDQPRLLRRARGYVPTPIPLTQSLPPLLACGSGLKNTFCLVRENMAFISQHIGDLFNLESLAFFKESIYHFQKILDLQPQVVVCDLHPDYLSSRHGKELGLPLILVQHHHAHAVAVMAEHGLQDKVLAIILDGTGVGPDGTIWGGEILEVTLTDFIRRGCLAPLPLPGGDSAAEQPWRMGLAALYHCFGEEGQEESRLPSALLGIAEEKRAAIVTMMRTGFNTPLTSSCGRLFDAVAALLGIRLNCDFEGQAAMELEALARQWQQSETIKESTQAMDAPESCAPMVDVREEVLWGYKAQPEEPRETNELFIMDSSQFIREMLGNLHAGRSIPQLAMDFHRWLIKSLATTINKIAATSTIRTVVLSGGCLQNTIIMEGLFQALEQDDFQVFTGQQVPVNDGGISLGQAVIGGLRYVSGNTHAGH